MDASWIDSLTGLKLQFQPGTECDVADRLSYRFSSALFLFIAFLVGAKQYLGNPITCWMPAEFTGFWEEYTEQLCFINSTYWIRPGNHVPIDQYRRLETTISYYQWTPWVLAVQALIFFLPHLVWKLTNWKSGINVKHVVVTAANLQSERPSNRTEKLVAITGYIKEALQMQREYKRSKKMTKMQLAIFRKVCCFMCNVKSGTFLSTLYLFVKLIYVLEVAGNFFILQAFLDEPLHFYGITMVKNLINWQNWQETGLFPRMTLCDFSIRRIGGITPYTVQCVLPLNMINEKLFTFLWWWVLALFIISVFSLIMWLDRVLFSYSRRNFLTSYLLASDEYQSVPHEARLIREFESKYLRQDGVFVMRLVSWNAGISITSRILNLLWRDFLNVKGIQLENETPPQEGMEMEPIDN